jgi:3-deoxy-D-manno-octulosonate 8-phosphate phosphatase (KDO 8-P phosphatase)
MTEPDDIAARAARIKLLALDADGVLTDGGLYYGPPLAEGDRAGDWGRFDIKDGMGIWRLRHIGCEVAIVSGRQCEAVRARAVYLGVTEVQQGVLDKAGAVRELAQARGLDLAEVAFMGDDLNDLEAMRIVGLPAAPADAVPEVQAVAAFVSSRDGGRGAVRELCELIIAAHAEAAERADGADWD